MLILVIASVLQRFNVAVTRAKALLIVVGNPYLLRMDPNWNQLLQYVIGKGGYTGCDMDVEMEENLDIMDRLAAVKLDTVGKGMVMLMMITWSEIIWLNG